MARIGVLFVICLSLKCVWSYYYQNNPQPFPSNAVYRHQYPSFPTPYMPAPSAPFPMPFNPAPAPFHEGGAPMASYPGPFNPQAVQFHGGGAPPMHFPPNPNQPGYNQVPYAPAPTHQHNYFSRPQSPPPPRMRIPFSNPFAGTFQAAFSHNVPRHTIFSKIKPFLLGSTAPRSLPHHPYYPNHYHPHQFTPNRPLQNRPSAHHHYPVHHQPPGHMMQHMKQEHSCSCSLHVGHLTVYKHTDMRSSYSCHDLKDCNSFCTNLFSSEDLRAQTRSDACLIIGKDTTVPWFRRDQVCAPHGTKNDTKLSVDLCCKNLQPC